MPNRTTVIALATAALLVAPGLCAAQGPTYPKRIFSERAAERWEDALVSGNGTTGVMVYGRPLNETVIFTHGRLWVQMAEKKRLVPDVAGHLPKLRQLLAEKRWVDARRFACDVVGRGRIAAGRAAARVSSDSYHPAFQIKLTVPEDKAPSEYRRCMTAAWPTTAWRGSHATSRTRACCVPFTRAGGSTTSMQTSDTRPS